MPTIEAPESAQVPGGLIRIDEQTGRVFKIEPETPVDTIAAIGSIIYLLLAMVFFLWLLFDVWVGRMSVFQRGYPNEIDTLRKSVLFHLMAYTFIGGALGGIIAGYRSFYFWHCEERAFGWRYVWKYIAFPWNGGILASFVYAVLGSGVAVLGGGFTTGGEKSVTQNLSALAIGALVGYGTPNVVKWLDAQVTSFFKITPSQPSSTSGTQADSRTAGKVETGLDGCGVTVTTANATPDEQLPATEGGVA